MFKGIKSILAAAAATVALSPLAADAAPLVTVRMLTATDEPLVNLTAADAGTLLNVKIVATVNAGAVNSKGTINSLVAGTDGLGSARFNIFQSTSATTQIDFDAGFTLNPFFTGGTGQTGGTVDPRGNGSDNIEGFRAVAATGQFTLGSPILLGTGTFRIVNVGAGSSQVRMSYLASTAFAGDTVGAFAQQSPGALKINGGSNVLAAAADADPVFEFIPLSLIGGGPIDPVDAGLGTVAAPGYAENNIPIAGANGKYVSGIALLLPAVQKAALNVGGIGPESDTVLLMLNLRGEAAALAAFLADPAIAPLVVDQATTDLDQQGAYAGIFNDGDNGTTGVILRLQGTGRVANIDVGAGLTIEGAAAVPEPATMGLLALGAVGLLARRRRN